MTSAEMRDESREKTKSYSAQCNEREMREAELAGKTRFVIKSEQETSARDGDRRLAQTNKSRETRISIASNAAYLSGSRAQFHMTRA